MKLQAQYQTEVYGAGYGYIVIKQIDESGSDDGVVFLSTQQAEAVGGELLRWAHEQRDTEPGQ